MEQHPVPQPITSYEFRLVGDMTIKQFGKLASGVILALIVYGINPAPGILKWGLIGIFVSLGAGMAFLPFQGRPLDTWIISFFKRIYSPTQYVWRMNGKINVRPNYEQLVDTPAPWIPAQQAAINKPPVPDITQQTVRRKQPSDQNTVFSITNTKIPEPIPPTAPLKTETWHEGNTNQKTTIPTPSQNLDESPTRILYEPPKPYPPPINTQSQSTPLDEVTIGKTTIYSADSPNVPAAPNIHTLISKNRVTVPPNFNPSLLIPTLPNIPNILGGFVKNPEGKLVEGAIIEVRDSALNPVRAFKTNKLGQFQIATPLPNGVYEIETEKENLTFDIIRVELRGEILPPFEIIARSLSTTNNKA